MEIRTNTYNRDDKFPSIYLEQLIKREKTIPGNETILSQTEVEIVSYESMVNMILEIGHWNEEWKEDAQHKELNYIMLKKLIKK